VLDVWAHTHRPVVVRQDGARYHTSTALPPCCDAPADRLPIEPLPAYAPDCTPIAHLWKKVTQEATHLKDLPEFPALPAAVERALLHCAPTPQEITVLMARYGESLGAMAA
jgi:hypothetical protein